ncbi:hypothetical protein ESCO_003287 [Escovopsis weberi]|uniref:MAGE domain-containing protein n=1 Tax=Escovopsis weberi TaxID=150374 RepID=A0A0M9VSE2_ESCWE|nr:hypothetical protein ESCO_003287 [Escovopsis weberi]
MPRQRRVVEDEDEEETTQVQISDDDRAEESGSDAAGPSDQQLAKKLIRYALACEYSRVPIRREGIKERVLGKNGRSFRRIFKLAQRQMRDVWGMEFRELPMKEKMTLHEKRQAMKSNSQPRTGSGAFALSSTLPAAYRSPAIITPSRVPSVEEEATYTAFYTMVVSLIMLNGGELSDQKLQRYLLRLNADRNLASEKTDLVLKRMEKQGYVVKQTEGLAAGQDGGDQATTWHVGRRAKEEIGLDGVVGLVREVYGHPENEDFDKKLKSSLGIKDWPSAAVEEENAGSAMEEDG